MTKRFTGILQSIDNRKLVLLIKTVVLLCIFNCQILYAQKVKSLAIGETAPYFNLPGIDGKNYSLDDFKSKKAIVVIFTCNHCPTSQAYEDRIRRIVNDYSWRGVDIVAISPNNPLALPYEEMSYSDYGDGFEEMKLRAQDKKYNYPYLYDGDNQKVSKAYGPLVTPHAFVFDKNKQLRYHGRIDNTENPYKKPTSHELRMILDSILAGNKMPVEKTKPFGCKILWDDYKGIKDKVDNSWAKTKINLLSYDVDELKKLVKNYNDNIVLLVIWNLNNKSSTSNFNEIITTHRMYSSRLFEVITLNTNSLEEKEKVLDFLNRNNAAVTNVIYHPKSKFDFIKIIDEQWKGNMPYLLLIAPEGEILYRWEGEIDPVKIRKGIISEIGRYYAND